MVFIMLPNESAGRGMASIWYAWRSTFGRWAIPLWLLSGFVGLILDTIGVNYALPGIFDLSTGGVDGIIILLAVMMILVHVATGPVAIAVGILLPGMFFLFDFLSTVHA